MATLNIEGQRVTVDDSFLKLPPDQQNAAVDEIAGSLKMRGSAPTPAAQAPAGAPRTISMPAYDPAGNATGGSQDVQAAEAPPSKVRDQIDDVTKSIGGGLVRGTAGLAGLPELASRGIVRGVDAIEQRVRGETDEQTSQRIAERKRNVMFPGVSEAISPEGIQAGIEKVTGPAHEPTTRSGRFGSTAGEFAVGGAIGKLPNLIRNAITYGVIPGLASEGAGQAFEGSAAETPARIVAGLAGGVGAAAAQRASSAERLLQDATRGVTPAQLGAMEALMSQAQRAGTPISRAEALQAVTRGATDIGDLQHTVEGLGGLKQFHAERPAQTEAAARRTFDSISPAPANPSQIGPELGQTAERLVTDVRGAITNATRPMYAASAGNMVPANVHAAMTADPLFQHALDEVRRDPAKNSFVRNHSDRSVATYDAVAKELEERARNSAQPLNPQASQAVASATGTLGSDVKDIAIAADRAATVGPSSYEAALAAQTRLRNEYLNPLLNGPIGKVAGRDTTTKQAIEALFPERPLPNSAGEISDTMRALVARSPRTASELVRTHAEGVFNEAAQRLASGGPNQAGGAKFAAVLRGNPEQAANLEASVRALPNGDTTWQGFNQLLESLEAQQYRQAAGSRTAFKGPAVADMGRGGIIQSGAEVAASGGFNFPGKVKEAFKNWSVGRNLDQLSDLLVNPEAAARFRNLVEAPRGSAKAGAYATRLVNIALEAPKGSRLTRVDGPRAEASQ